MRILQINQFLLCKFSGRFILEKTKGLSLKDIFRNVDMFEVKHFDQLNHELNIGEGNIFIQDVAHIHSDDD
jgi:hypothetical protein